MRQRFLVLSSLLVTAFVLGLSACGGGGSPTEPGPVATPNASGSATVSGEVTLKGGNAIVTGPTNAAGLTSTAAGDASGHGVTVRVQGTGLSAAADASGHFDLSGVPGGDRVLLFEHGGTSAALGIPAVHDHESIEIEVTVTGSSAKLDGIHRSGGDGTSATLDPAALSLQIAPDNWNLNFRGSSGFVEAFVRGPGIDQIDLSSLELSGDDDSAEPLPAVSATLEGDHVRGRFPKSEVIDLLSDPQPKSTHTVTLSFTAKDSADVLELTATITVEGDDSGDDGGDDLANLSLQLSPSTWNLNYSKSSGHVTAFIRGDGLQHIDLDSIEMSGDNPEADPLAATSAKLAGNHVQADFPKNQVLDLLDHPERGSHHTVTVSVTDSDTGDVTDLTAEVTITGSAN